MRLPPYHLFSVCVKCSYSRGPETKPAVEFCPAIEGRPCPQGFDHDKYGEHHHRRCLNCGFIWAEAALPEWYQQRIHEENIERALTNPWTAPEEA